MKKNTYIFYPIFTSFVKKKLCHTMDTVFAVYVQETKYNRIKQINLGI